MPTGIDRDRARGKSKGRGSADDITQPTTTGDPPQTPSSEPSTREAHTPSSNRGRPQTIENPHRTTMTLEEDQIDGLDRICAEIKLSGGENLSRSNVMRALLDALIQSDLDYSQIRTEQDLRDLFLESVE